MKIINKLIVMTVMKKTSYFFAFFFSLFLLGSCNDSGDTIYMSSIDGSDLVATTSDVILSQENSKQVVLSLAWTKATLSISDPNMSAPDVLSTFVQASTKQDFSENVVETEKNELSVAYTGSELNALAKNLGLSPDQATPIFFRLSSTTGKNIASVYSNVVEVNVTAYEIDMTLGKVLDKDKQETALSLYAPLSDGKYTGFMGVGGYHNFFLQEGDGKTWGNLPIDGNAFLLSSEASSWNFWFPSESGCYYTIVDTKAEQWSALLLPTLTISGDIEAEMTYDRSNNRWIAIGNNGIAATKKIKLSTTGRQYNYSTGTDDINKAITTPVAFVQEGENLSLAEEAQDITIDVPAGEYTLIVDLSNPKAWTCKATSGSLEPEEVREMLFLPGISDGEGSWTFDQVIKLYDEESLGYANVIEANAPWGYSINLEKDNWADKYTFVSGDAYAGTIALLSPDIKEVNLPSPSAGVYLIDVSLKSLTYELTTVGSEIYISGLNNEWTFDVSLPQTNVKGVYSGPIEIKKKSTDGFLIYLKNGDWEKVFGGGEGKLTYKQKNSNIKDDQSLDLGVYTMTVDVINKTYSIAK